MQTKNKIERGAEPPSLESPSTVGAVPALVAGGQGRDADEVVYSSKIVGLIFLALSALLVLSAIITFS